MNRPAIHLIERVTDDKTVAGRLAACGRPLTWEPGREVYEPAAFFWAAWITCEACQGSSGYARIRAEQDEHQAAALAT